MNGKSVPGPNTGNCRGDVRAPKIPDCAKTPYNYVLTLEKASLWAAPVPRPAELEALTARVAENNHFAASRIAHDPVIAQLQQRIKHVIYIVKENRTYDQVLGDLEKGDGDPSHCGVSRSLLRLTTTPLHVTSSPSTIFYDSGEVSGVGWNWSTAARTTDYTEKSVPPSMPAAASTTTGKAPTATSTSASAITRNA